MSKLETSKNSTNTDNTNEVHIFLDDESNDKEVTSINDAQNTEDTPKVINPVNNYFKDGKDLTTTNENTEVTALVEVKPRSLLVAQTMFKKSIKISIKSFLISLSLGFLNLFF